MEIEKKDVNQRLYTWMCKSQSCDGKFFLRESVNDNLKFSYLPPYSLAKMWVRNCHEEKHVHEAG